MRRKVTIFVPRQKQNGLILRCIVKDALKDHHRKCSKSEEPPRCARWRAVNTFPRSKRVLLRGLLHHRASASSTLNKGIVKTATACECEKTLKIRQKQHKKRRILFLKARYASLYLNFSHLLLCAKDKNENLCAERIPWRIVRRKRREYLRFLSRARQRRKGTKKNSDSHFLRKIWTRMEGARIISIIITGDEDTKTRLNSRSFSYWE